jgi:hypothetical protein
MNVNDGVLSAVMCAKACNGLAHTLLAALAAAGHSTVIQGDA